MLNESFSVIFKHRVSPKSFFVGLVKSYNTYMIM